jgi:hypothetical protein
MLISDLCSSHAHNLAAADRQYTPFLEILAARVSNISLNFFQMILSFSSELVASISTSTTHFCHFICGMPL